MKEQKKLPERQKFRRNYIKKYRGMTDEAWNELLDTRKEMFALKLWKKLHLEKEQRLAEELSVLSVPPIPDYASCALGGIVYILYLDNIKQKGISEQLIRILLFIDHSKFVTLMDFYEKSNRMLKKFLKQEYIQKVVMPVYAKPKNMVVVILTPKGQDLVDEFKAFYDLTISNINEYSVFFTLRRKAMEAWKAWKDRK